MQKRQKQKIKRHPYTRSWSPFCQDVEFCSWLALTFFTNLIPTYLYQRERKLFSPFGMEIRAFFKKKKKTGKEGTVWETGVSGTILLRLLLAATTPFHADPASWWRLCFLLLLIDVLFESSATCMCAKPSFRNSLFLIRNGVFFLFHQSVLGFYLFERSSGSCQNSSHLFNSDVEGKIGDLCNCSCWRCCILFSCSRGCIIKLSINLLGLGGTARHHQS